MPNVKNRQKTDGKSPIPNNKEFQKGQSGNPNGRPKKFITTVTEATGYKKSQVNDCYLSMLKMTMTEIKRVVDDPKSPALEVLVGRGIHGDAKRGELKNLESMLNRAIGKPTENIELDGNINLGLSKEMEIAVKILNERNRNRE